MNLERSITSESTLISALKKMDELDKKLMIVLRNNKFHGLLSVGDIQRAIIQNKSLDTKIHEVMRKNIRVAHEQDDFETIKKMMLEFRMELCPVIDDNNEIKQVYYWEDLFSDQKIAPKGRFNLPVVIMAGGFGTRLRPLTNVIPKPLIPIGDKTMLEHIFENFKLYGCKDFHISVNYKSELIEFYIDQLNLPLNVTYFKEDKPMGTAGSLSLLKNKLNGTFFVSNCDILIEADYSEILAYHQKNQNEITIISAIKSFEIPYGTLETSTNGLLKEIKEKPELTYQINSGMYILEPHLLDEIPSNEFFHITHLIENVLARNGKVGVFPVSEKSWKDIGVWSEYLKNSIHV